MDVRHNRVVITTVLFLHWIAAGYVLERFYLTLQHSPDKTRERELILACVGVLLEGFGQYLGVILGGFWKVYRKSLGGFRDIHEVLGTCLRDLGEVWGKRLTDFWEGTCLETC